jgi:hypothetical protein
MLMLWLKLIKFHDISHEKGGLQKSVQNYSDLWRTNRQLSKAETMQNFQLGVRRL